MLATALVSIAAAGHAYAQGDSCDGLLPRSPSGEGVPRTITADDLVRLRDLGPTDPTDVRAAILTVSPDGRDAAFQMRQADPVTNRYCFGMFVLPLDGEAPVRIVDQGGDFIPIERSTPQGFAAFTSPGLPRLITPAWSPDGRRIAYLRRDGDHTQIWLAWSDGHGSRPLTHLGYDVMDFAWLRDGKTLVFSGRPALETVKAAIKTEARTGYLYDDRYVPANSSIPLPREPIPTQIFVVDVATGEVNAADPLEASVLSPPRPANLPPKAQLFAGGAQGRLAWTQPVTADDIHARPVLYRRSASGTIHAWLPPENAVVTDVWWQGQDLTIMTLEGWGRGWTADQQGIYVWPGAAAAPHEVLKTHDVLIGCVPARDDLICGQETPTQPREIVRVRLSDGHVSSLFNPNPVFQHIRVGPVKHLTWRNTRGLEAFGDLVLPPEHRPGQRHPLIVVQYRSRGFLRGGTGDEFPIQLYAAHGFSVLRFSHPVALSDVLPAKSWQAAERKSTQGWADRKSIESALEVGVAKAIATGTVDPKHIGVTGLSDGATTVQFALLNSHLFSAAAIATCCDEPSVTGMLAGPAPERFFQSLGYPNLTERASSFWAHYAFRWNARDVTAPILVQAADREYLGALEAFTALKAAGKPIEMYVFPDEYHILWQPAHRLAAYQRSLDWLSYWLKGERDPDPEKAAQYQRWDDLKRRMP